MPDNIPSIKNQLRQESKRLRSRLTPEACRTASASICEHIQAWSIFQAARRVLTYMPMGSEVDLSPLLTQSPQKEWAIPRVLPGNRMAFHLYEPSKLIRHPYGMLEPDPSCPVISTEEVQLALVPGLAFDMKGWRLGYGGGFYDRFLSGYSSCHAGITYQILLAENIPHAQHDIPMQYLITEQGIIDALL